MKHCSCFQTLGFCMQNFKIDSIEEGEPVLCGGKFVPHMTDHVHISLRTGPLMWSEGRFRNVPGCLGHVEYESMCKKLAKTSKWESSRPEKHFKPRFAEYTTRPMGWESMQESFFAWCFFMICSALIHLGSRKLRKQTIGDMNLFR
jgi:hypothetical protein